MSVSLGGSGSGGGGSSLASQLAALNTQATTKQKPKKRKPEKRHGIGGLFLNLGDDVKDAAIGFIPGIYNVGKGTVSDVGNAFEYAAGNKKAFEEDEDGVSDIFEAIAKDYEDTYSPLIRGDFDTFGKKLYDNPLGPILDVLTVLTGGSAGASKLAKVNIKATGKVSKRSANRLGLERLEMGDTPASILAAERGATLNPGLLSNKKAAYTDDTGGVYVPRRRVTRTSSSLMEQGLFDPETGKTRRKDLLTQPKDHRARGREWSSAAGKAWDTQTVSGNKFQRSTEDLADLVGELFPDMRGLGSNRRAGRQSAQQLDRKVGRDAKALGLAELEAVIETPDKLGGARGSVKDPLVQAALDNKLRGVDGEKRVAQLETDVADLPNLSGRLDELKRERAETAQVLRQVAARERFKQDPEAAQHYANLADELAGAADDTAAKARKGVANAELRLAEDNGVDPERFHTKDGGRKDRPAENRKAAAIMRRKIAERIRDEGADAVAADIATRIKLGERADYYEPLMTTEAALQRRLLTDGLDKKQTKIFNRLLAVVPRAAEGTTKLLEEGGVKPREGIENLAQRTTGVKDGEFADAVKVPSRTTMKSQGSSPSPKNPAKPSAAKLETGIAYRTAEHMKDPRIIAATMRDAQKWRKTQEAWRGIVGTGIELDAGEALPKGFKLVDNEKVQQYIVRATDMLENDAPVAFGDSPQLKQVQDLMRDGIAARFGDNKRIAVPAKIHEKMMSEISSGNKALTEWIDRPTALWRALTLTIRPAFYVNNLLGQTLLLLATHGAYKTIRTGIEYTALGKAKRAELADASGGVSFGGQSSFMRRETNKALASKSFQWAVLKQIAPVIKDGNDLMLKLGQAITDDPIRRMSMLEELRGPSIALAKEKGITRGDAMTMLLDNEQVMRRIEEKVLGDLVDFSNLTEGERMIVRRGAPFYSWVKGSTKRTLQLVKDEPGKANVYANIGTQAAEDIQEELGGPVPDFILGSILGKDTDKDGRRTTAVTAGFSPFTSPADVLGMATMLAGKRPPSGGSNPVSHLNPLLQIPIEAFTNKDSFSGDQINNGDKTIGRQLLGATAMSTPLASSLYGANQKLKDPAFNERAMYRASITNEVLKYLGVPIRDLNAERAVAVGDVSAAQLAADIPAEGEASWVTGPDGRMYALEDRGHPDEWESNKK